MIAELQRNANSPSSLRSKSFTPVQNQSIVEQGSKVRQNKSTKKRTASEFRRGEAQTIKASKSLIAQKDKEEDEDEF